MESLLLSQSSFASPIGHVVVLCAPDGLVEVRLQDDAPAAADTPSEMGMRAVTQLKAYFEGKLREFDLPLSHQGTEFQGQVWSLLRAIPFGSTRSYMDLAVALRKPKAVRAVGAANGQNPIAIIVPCHRVVGSNGSLTGYAGGLHRKEWLLKHEHDIAHGRQNTLF